MLRLQVEQLGLNSSEWEKEDLLDLTAEVGTGREHSLDRNLPVPVPPY